MDTKKYKTILTKEGYLLNKKKFNKKELDTVMKELTVQPQLSYSVGVKSKLEKFEVYKENDEFLSIPKYYGIGSSSNYKQTESEAKNACKEDAAFYILRT